MRNRVLFALSCFLPVMPAIACSPCRAHVQAGIFDSGFGVRLAVILLPVVVVLLAGLGCWLWAGRGGEP